MNITYYVVHIPSNLHRDSFLNTVNHNNKHEDGTATTGRLNVIAFEILIHTHNFYNYFNFFSFFKITS